MTEDQKKPHHCRYGRIAPALPDGTTIPTLKTKAIIAQTTLAGLTQLSQAMARLRRAERPTTRG